MPPLVPVAAQAVLVGLQAPQPQEPGRRRADVSRVYLHFKT